MRRILLVMTAAALVATTMLTTGAADPAFAQDGEPLVCTIGEERLMTEAETERYPEGHWMRSQGQYLSINSYQALFAVIGYTYGGNARIFVLPDRPDPDPNPNGEHWYICAWGLMPPRGGESITKDQCKNGGYATLGFRNQGDCTSFVATEGKNEPGKNQKTK